MTIKEIESFTGKKTRAVRNWIKKATDKGLLQGCAENAQGYAIDYNIDQVEIILNESSMSKDAVNVLMQNARQETTVINTNNSFSMQMFADMMAVSLATALKPIYDRLDSVEKKPELLQIEHIPEIPSRVIFRKYIDELVKISNSDHSTVYNRVYSEMGYVYGIKIKARAKNANLKPIDILERDNYMGKAIAITRQMIEQVDK